MLITYSHSTCATARLFIAKGIFERKNSSKYIIITDKEQDQKLIDVFSMMITGKKWRYVHTIADYFEMARAQEGFFLLLPHVLEISGKKEYIEKKVLHTLKRSSTQTMEAVIELLIELGYHHSTYTGELGTYKREGSVITLTHASTGNLYQIEWFDTQIDSIIEIDTKGQRSFRETIDIKNERIGEAIFERNTGKLNEELLGLLGNGTEQQENRPYIILNGCDFHPELEKLRNLVDIHFTDFHREDSVSLDVSIPDLPHIESLKHYIAENSTLANIRIYTKNEKTVLDFLEFHKLSGCEIIGVEKKGLESCEFECEYEVGGMKYKYEDQGVMMSEIQPEGQQPRTENREPRTENREPRTENQEPKTIILTDDILDSLFVRTRSKKSLAKNLDLLLHLHPGDYVVHREHGIARFHMVIEKTLADIRREYLELHYAGGDKLFVPLTDIYRVSKYVGELEPTLTSLAGKEWERTLEKTDEELEQIANELIEIASKRTLAKGITFQKFPKEEEEFRSRFPYEYTPDQRETIDEIFRDMESEFPMDRLLSGDVGFGKTEVAMNAIYKAILSGYQVAVISPLLVLADEHYETFLERFHEYGIRVECLTRMTSTREEKRILEEMKSGTTDIVIGTHKLFGEQIRWKKLGLLIIDEEHKFGVSHKETIKKMRANIDILTLSATPIPRSLNLALSGLKKVSLLSTPPKKKKPIETIVTAWNEHTIRHAIDYELERGGQVIIIHNRIRGMESMEKEIGMILKSDEGGKMSRKKKRNVSGEWGFEQENQQNGGSGDETVGVEKKKGKGGAQREEASFLSPETFDTFTQQGGTDGYKSMKHGFQGSGIDQEVQKTGLLRDTRIDETENQEPRTENREPRTENQEPRTENQEPRTIITHGQMPGEQIEDRIHAFKKGEYNILLTTTIIENGVNFLRANTIIIIDPEDFGLAQLHQLRGRVGRKGEQSYCYLMYRKGELAAIEKERIITIANNTHLGAGFEIAMRDMEIRGAGDVLGFKQAGKSKDIGLTLYFRMLEEKIASIKDEKLTKKPVKIELDLSYTLDNSLFQSDLDKLNFFREIENIESLEELDEVEEEMRYKLGTITENIPGAPAPHSPYFIPHTSLSNVFLLLRSRIIFSEYNIESLKKVGQNYIFDFSDGTRVEKIRAFLDRFDRKNRMTLLSVKKIRTEVRYWKTPQEFLEEMVRG